MQQAAYERLDDEILAIFDYNPPLLKQEKPSPIKLLSPPFFYNKHVDPRLSLQQVILMPSLSDDLTRCIDEALDSLKKRKERLPLIEDGDSFVSKGVRNHRYVNTQVSDGASVAHFYRSTTASYCLPIASTLAFHPHGRGWFSVFKWYRAPGAPTREEYEAVEEMYGPQITAPPNQFVSVHEKLWTCLDDDDRNILHEISQRLPVMATWIMFSALKESEMLLKNMGILARDGLFYSEICSTAGGVVRSPTTQLSPDAIITPWTIPPNLTTQKAIIRSRNTNSGNIVSTTKLPRRSVRLEKSSDVSNKTKRMPLPAKISKPGIRSAPSQPKIVIPRTTRSDRGVSANAYVQHAWTRSVVNDSTFIIFQCGNYERIGLRHRGTQTLYLSELIDVPNCKSPAYGRIHIGLHMAILQDAIDRVKQQCKMQVGDTSVGAETSSNRVESERDEISSKRRKTRSEDAKIKREAAARQVSYETVLTETLRRDVALIQLHYGIYNSPSPASFLRSDPPLKLDLPRPPHKGKSAATDTKERTFEASNYLTLILTSVIGQGATGVVHGATLEIVTPDGNHFEHNVVVKLALSPEQRGKMRKEYSVYKFLADSDVTEIVQIFGLFEDVEDDATVLVMSHGGISLKDRRTDKTSAQVVVSSSEKDAFIRAVDNIHRAGVCHHDIRPDNLLINDVGEVFVIDFDMADVSASVGSRKREREHLVLLLEGRYMPPNLFPSPATTKDSVNQSSDHASASESGKSRSSAGATE